MESRARDCSSRGAAKDFSHGRKAAKAVDRIERRIRQSPETRAGARSYMLTPVGADTWKAEPAIAPAAERRKILATAARPPRPWIGSRGGFAKAQRQGLAPGVTCLRP